MAYVGNSSVLFQANEAYIAELYESYLTDPDSVDKSWSDLFDSLKAQDGMQTEKRPSWSQR